MTTSSGDIYRSQQTKVYNTTKTPEQKTTYTETVSEAYAKAAKQYPSIEAPMSNSGFKVTMGNVGALVDDAANLGLASISALTGNIGGLQYAIGNLTGAVHHNGQTVHILIRQSVRQLLPHRNRKTQQRQQ